MIDQSLAVRKIVLASVKLKEIVIKLIASEMWMLKVDTLIMSLQGWAFCNLRRTPFG